MVDDRNLPGGDVHAGSQMNEEPLVTTESTTTTSSDTRNELHTDEADGTHRAHHHGSSKKGLMQKMKEGVKRISGGIKREFGFTTSSDIEINTQQHSAATSTDNKQAAETDSTGDIYDNIEIKATHTSDAKPSSTTTKASLLVAPDQEIVTTVPLQPSHSTENSSLTDSNGHENLSPGRNFSNTSLTEKSSTVVNNNMKEGTQQAREKTCLVDSMPEKEAPVLDASSEMASIGEDAGSGRLLHPPKTPPPTPADNSVEDLTASGKSEVLVTAAADDALQISVAASTGVGDSVDGCLGASSRSTAASNSNSTGSTKGRLEGGDMRTDSTRDTMLMKDAYLKRTIKNGTSTESQNGSDAAGRTENVRLADLADFEPVTEPIGTSFTPTDFSFTPEEEDLRAIVEMDHKQKGSASERLAEGEEDGEKVENILSPEGGVIEAPGKHFSYESHDGNIPSLDKTIVSVEESTAPLIYEGNESIVHSGGREDGLGPLPLEAFKPTEDSGTSSGSKSGGGTKVHGDPLLDALNSDEAVGITETGRSETMMEEWGGMKAHGDPLLEALNSNGGGDLSREKPKGAGRAKGEVGEEEGEWEDEAEAQGKGEEEQEGEAVRGRVTEENYYKGGGSSRREEGGGEEGAWGGSVLGEEEILQLKETQALVRSFSEKLRSDTEGMREDIMEGGVRKEKEHMS